jgi:hypothetical protein
MRIKKQQQQKQQRREKNTQIRKIGGEHRQETNVLENKGHNIGGDTETVKETTSNQK